MLKTLSFGAVIWDIVDGKCFLGGDSLNVASHLSKLGAESYYLTCLGYDDPGKTAYTQIKKIGTSFQILENRNCKHKAKKTKALELFFLSSISE